MNDFDLALKRKLLPKEIALLERQIREFDAQVAGLYQRRHVLVKQHDFKVLELRNINDTRGIDK